MGSEQCTSCGTAIPSGARFCPRCGRQADLPLLELERLDRPGAIVSSATVVHGGDGGSRHRGIAALAAAVVALGAIIVLLSGGGGDGGDAAPVAESTTTDPRTSRTHLIYPSSTRPGETTTSRPTTTRAPTTTSTTTTVVSYVGVAPGTPVLGETTNGLSIYVASGSEVSRLDLDSGQLTTISVVRLMNSWQRIDVRADRVLFDVGGSYYQAPRDLVGGLGASDVPWDGGNGIPGTDLRWSNDFDPDGRQLIRLRRGDEVIAEHEVPAGAMFVHAVDDRVVFTGGGRIYTIDRDARVRPYATGTVVGISAGWVLWWGCDDVLRCRAHLGDATDPDVRAINVGDFGSLGYGWYLGESVVSPDGRLAMLPDENRQVLVDLDTGQALFESMLYGPFVWSPDSRWLFRVDEARRVEAVSTTDGRVIELLGRLDGDVNSYPVLGVG